MINDKFCKEMAKLLKFIELFHNKDLFVTVYFERDERTDETAFIRNLFCTSNDNHKVRWHPCMFFYEDSDYNIKLEYDKLCKSVIIDTSKMMSEHFVNIKIGYSSNELDEWFDVIGRKWESKHYRHSKKPCVTRSYQVMPQEEFEAFCRNDLMSVGVPMKKINQLFPIVKRIK